MPTFCPPVRLVGGNSENVGRVEVYYNNTWGTVCGDTYWSVVDSNTVCRQLGYTGAFQYYYSTAFVSESVPVWMDRVSCGTLNLCLGKCNFNGFGNNYCRHSQDIVVNCTGISDTDKLGNELYTFVGNTFNSYTMGTSGLPRIYTCSLRAAGSRAEVYMSGKPQEHMV